MGGTSCDVALIKDGEPLISGGGKIEGRDLAVPMLDINTVSAGGGTIATVDRFGVLQVGPQSAGALPGPACYGRGGAAPTITDCNLVLGHLGEDSFLGGRMRLDAAKARAAIETQVARPLGLGATAAAEGIVRIIDVKMEEAIKAISTMRGHDLRDFFLLAFGGAGPVHAGRLARDLGMAGVIVPLYPGVFSAMGLLMSDVKHDYIRSRMTPLSEVTPADVNGMLDRLGAQARDELDGDGFAPAHIRVERALDMRYAGQGYEIAVPCPARALAAVDLTALRVRFRSAARHDVRTHGAGGAGRDRLLPRARHRSGAAGRIAEIQADGRHARGCHAREEAGAVRWRRCGLSGLSTRADRCRTELDRSCHPRPARLHDRDLSRPDERAWTNGRT